MISVIMPTRNRPKWLEFSLHSIFMQTYQEPFEVIVIDDSERKIQGENKHIIDKFIGMDVWHFSLGRGHTISWKLDFAIRELANGDIIAQADDDDYHCPERLETQLKLLENVEIVLCPKPFWAYHNKDEVYQLITNAHPLGMVQGSTFCYRRSTYLAAGGYSPETGNVHDKILGVHFQAIGCRVAHCGVDRPLQIAFEHGSNFWSGYRDLTTVDYKKTDFKVSAILDEKSKQILDNIRSNS